MKKKLVVFSFIVTSFFLTSCKGNNPQTLTVMTHDSFSMSEDLLNEFQAENNVSVKFITAGDAGTALNKAILSKENPFADVFYGVDNTFLSRALEEDIFEPYKSPMIKNIPEEFFYDDDFRAIPVDFGDVCLNYQISYFNEKHIKPPNSLDDLLKPEYQGLLVVENPATSSPGLAFLLTTIGVYGEDGYLNYWEALMDNDLLVVNDWETAYYTEFSQWGGTRPIVLSYGSSPPFEVIFSEEPIDTPPTAPVVSDGTCYRQIEYVGILRGTPNRKLAEKWIDFMLSKEFQEDIPMQMFVFPVNQDAELNPIFTKYLGVPENPVMLEPSEISRKREKWIREWTDTVLK